MNRVVRYRVNLVLEYSPLAPLSTGLSSYEIHPGRDHHGAGGKEVPSIMRVDGQLALLEEFERSVENRRRKAAEVIQDDERHFDEKRRKDVERKEEEHQRFAEEMAATLEQVSHFHERLDRYDTGVVHALMDNRQALYQADDTLADIRRRASVLPDGRRVYRSENGQHVFDDTGNSVGRDVIDPTAISPGAPSW